MRAVADLACGGLACATGALRRITSGAKCDPGCACGCEIPPPCWVPRKLGRKQTRACPGESATVALRLENCGVRPRSFAIESSGDDEGIAITPAKLTLGPFERASVSAVLPVAANAAKGSERELLLWVRGCHDHVLRWTVTAGRPAVRCCPCVVDVRDCPDLVHHWYDHFYCEHPCRHGRDVVHSV
jgi:hypothetical protein